MFEKMRDIIAQQLGIDSAEVTMESSFKDDLGADSLDLFELVMNLEEEYGLEIATEDLSALHTVGDVITYLKEHGIEE